MVWGDRPKATQPWRGASTLVSLKLHSEALREPALPIVALRQLSIDVPVVLCW